MDPYDPTLPNTGNPGEATAAASPAVAMMDRARRAQQMQAVSAQLEQQKAALEATKEQQAQNQTNRTLANQTASGDAAQWVGTPDYAGVPYSAAPPEAKQHFMDAYASIPGGGNGIADQIPQIWNQAQSNALGKPVGLNIGAGDSATAEVNGNKVSVQKEQPSQYTDPQTNQRMRWDPETKIASPVVVNNDTTPISGGGNTTGDDYLQTLDPKMAANIKAIAEGRQSLNIFPARGPQRANAAAMVQQYDPTADATTLPARQKTRQDFTSGNAANAIRSGNTAVEHLQELADAIPGLNNTGSKWVNAGKNFVSGGVSNEGSKALGNFNTVKTAVADELAKFYGGKGAATVSAIHDWQNNINPNDPPETIRGNINAAIQLLGRQMETYREQYETGMGKSKDIPFIQPKTAAILRTLKNKSGIDTGGLEDFDKQPSAGAPAPATPQSQPLPPHPQDNAAIEWARANPKNPLAAQILKANGL